MGISIYIFKSLKLFYLYLQGLQSLAGEKSYILGRKTSANIQRADPPPRVSIVVKSL